MPKPGEAEAELCRYTRHDLRNAQPIFLCAKSLIDPLRSGPELKPRSPSSCGRGWRLNRRLMRS